MAFARFSRIYSRAPITFTFGGTYVMPTVYLELIRGGFTLAAAGLAAWIALSLYFRQKEYELIKQRYLEGGVDVVAADIEHALGIVSHNWARCLHVVKLYRDEREHLDAHELEKGFVELDMSQFSRTAHHRIGSLVGSQVIWEVYQLALAFSTNENGKIQEIVETIRLKLKTDVITSEPQQMVSAMLKELRRVDDESHKYANLTRELYALGLMLETDRLSHTKIAKFSRRPEVQALTNRLRAKFADQLASHNETAA